MTKEYDNFVEISIAEEELISGGFVRRLFRSAGRAVKSVARFTTSKRTWKYVGYAAGIGVAAFAMHTGGSPYVKGDGSGVKEVGGTWEGRF